MSLKRICAIDLGSDTIKVTDGNEKLYVCEKNMIAIRNKKDVIALGNPAWEIFEKAPTDVYAGCPVKDGALAEGRNQELILVYVLKKFSTFFTRHPNVYIAAPSDISQVERRAYYKIFGGGLGAKKIRFVEKAVADAAGIGMPMDDPMGRMVVNLGAAHTEIAVLSEGKVILNRVLPTGGKHLDDVIASMVRRQYQLHIGSRTAQLLKESLARMGREAPGRHEGFRYSLGYRSPQGRGDFRSVRQRGDYREYRSAGGSAAGYAGAHAPAASRGYPPNGNLSYRRRLHDSRPLLISAKGAGYPGIQRIGAHSLRSSRTGKDYE